MLTCLWRAQTEREILNNMLWIFFLGGEGYAKILLRKCSGINDLSAINIKFLECFHVLRLRVFSHLLYISKPHV